jgi:hypothetical protein
VARATDLIPTQVVNKDHHNVRLAFGFREGGARRNKPNSEQSNTRKRWHGYPRVPSAAFAPQPTDRSRNKDRPGNNFTNWGECIESV